jgi:phage shock protein E
MTSGFDFASPSMIKENAMRKTYSLLLTLILLAGCGIPPAPAQDAPPFSNVSPAQAAALIESQAKAAHFTILDVRRAEEFASGHLKNAVQIDVTAADFADRIESLNKADIYLVYCHGGVRSARAMGIMKDHGFAAVYNLEGGLLKWQSENRPVVKDE